MDSSALVLVQLGTPEAPTPEKVGPYLRQFLMDPFVIDIPWVLRWPLVNWAIVPRRAIASAAAYKKVWNEQGSPLRYHSQALAEKLQQSLPDVQVRLAMRYGSPDIESVLSDVALCRDIYVIPLYPQYALSSTETALSKLRRWYRRSHYSGTLHFLENFYEHEAFINSQSRRIQEVHEKHDVDHTLMSFHGLPVRQVRKCFAGCLRNSDCCDSVRAENEYCYRAQSFATARALAKQLQLNPDQYTVSFQSRLGRAQWIPPYTDEIFSELVNKGVRRLAVTCPSFVADCLETLEEIGLRGREQFRQAGGDDLFLVPAVNSEDDWVAGLSRLFHESRRWRSFEVHH